METFYQILAVMAAVLIFFILYKTIKGRPEQFSRDKLSQSFFFMGVLALILIVFIAFLIMMLKLT